MVLIAREPEDLNILMEPYKFHWLLLNHPR